MKTKQISLIVSTILIITGIAFSANSQSDDNRPVIGILFDTSPLPELLNKHLGLKSGQGIRIANIMQGSGAEEKGLERDDIVIAFQGKELYDRETLTNKVKQLDVGSEVSMEIIHLGKRKEVTLKLKALKDTKGWKYEDEPQTDQFFQPGRIFSKGPGDDEWTQIFGTQIPGDVRMNMNSVFNEMYSSTYFINGKQYSVTIEGSPTDDKSKITVQINNDKYETTIGKMDEMPADYKSAAKKAIENAKQKSNMQFNSFPDGFGMGNGFMSGININSPQINVPNSPMSPNIQRMQEQMRQMEDQFRQLEKSHQRLLEQLNQSQSPKQNQGPVY